MGEALAASDCADLLRDVGPIAFLGVDPNYALGPEAWVPGYRVVCRHMTGVVPLLESAGVDVFCLERVVDGLPGRSTAALAVRPEVLDWIGRDVSILMFKPSSEVEAVADRQGWRILGAPARIARPFENKLRFFRLMDALALPCPRWMEVDLSTLTYAELASSLGPRTVVQGAHGFSGNRTFEVDDPASFEFARARLSGRKARAAERVAGRPVTLNACVLPDGRVRVGRLFHQVTGAPACTVYPLGACGNDWAAEPVSDLVQAAAQRTASAVGTALHAKGFRGIFGMDFVATSAGGVVAIETNPRLVSSIPMTTRLEVSQGEVPLMVWHLRATAGLPVDAPLSEPYPRLQGAQLVLHNLSGAPARLHGDLSAGVYRLVEGRPHWQRASYRVDDCAMDEEFLVLAPSPGHVLMPAAECARVQMRRAVLRFDGWDGPGVLTDEADAIARAVYAALDLRRADDVAAEGDEE